MTCEPVQINKNAATIFLDFKNPETTKTLQQSFGILKTPNPRNLRLDTAVCCSVVLNIFEALLVFEVPTMSDQAKQRCAKHFSKYGTNIKWVDVPEIGLKMTGKTSVVIDGRKHRIPYAVSNDGDMLMEMDSLNFALTGCPCSVCDRKTPRRFRCSACRRVYYCSAECQHADWHEHKPNCKPR